MKVKMGNCELEMGSRYLTELMDSSGLMEDIPALQRRMADEGYLFIRGFHDREKVLQARNELLNKMAGVGRLDLSKPVEEGYIGTENKGFGFRNTALEYPLFLELVNSQKVMDFFTRFLGGESITYDTKWFRGVQKGAFSGAHYDIVYMGKGTKNLYTVWTPLGDIPPEMGGLAICLGSNRLDRVKETYGKSDYEQVDGWFSNDPIEVVDRFGGQWATAHYKPGDAVIFGMYTMHGSLVNMTNRYRLSCDTRYQLRSEPADPRWYGNKLKDEVEPDTPKVSMKEARQNWRI